MRLNERLVYLCEHPEAGPMLAIAPIQRDLVVDFSDGDRGVQFAVQKIVTDTDSLLEVLDVDDRTWTFVLATEKLYREKIKPSMPANEFTVSLDKYLELVAPALFPELTDGEPIKQEEAT